MKPRSGSVRVDIRGNTDESWSRRIEPLLEHQIPAGKAGPAFMARIGRLAPTA